MKLVCLAVASMILAPLAPALAIDAKPPPNLHKSHRKSPPPVAPAVVAPAAGPADSKADIPFEVQAWAFERDDREVYVKDIRITEVGNFGNTINQFYSSPTFSVQSLTLDTAHPNKRYQVNVTWSDGSHYSNWFDNDLRSGRTVMVQGPL